jgi:sigma-B regulation protein RsbU (phosphoserine phosphatase)
MLKFNNIRSFRNGKYDMTELFIMSGPGNRGRTFEIRDDVVYLGRSPDNDVQVNDRFVSRRHLKIIRKGDIFFIEDLYSKNGTFLNGEPISPGVECRLSEGLPVVVGMSIICLGKGCSKEILSFLESANWSRMGLAEGDSFPNRPSTVQKNMELVYRVCDALTYPFDIHQTLKRILDHVFEVLVRIDRGAIILIDSETRQVKETITRTKQQAPSLPFSKEVVNQVLIRREAVMISDADMEQAERDLPETLKLLNIKSVLCVPLINGSKLWGVLYADSVTKPYGFRGEDLHLLSALSIPVAMAIENALFTPKMVSRK